MGGLGVLGGIAKYLDVDPTVVRVIYVIVFLLNPVTAILLYFTLALIIPEEPGKEISPDKLPEKAEKIAKEIEETQTQERYNKKLLAVILIILGGFLKKGHSLYVAPSGRRSFGCVVALIWNIPAGEGINTWMTLSFIFFEY